MIMLTKKRNRSSVFTKKRINGSNITITNRVKKKLEIYRVLLFDFDLRKKKCIAEFNECLKHAPKIRQLTHGYSFLTENIFPEIENLIQKYIFSVHFDAILDKLINLISKESKKIFKEWTFIYAVNQVEYRNKHGLLYTLPSKKLDLLETVYPKIRSIKDKSQLLSRYTYKKDISSSAKTRRVWFKI